MRIIEMIDYLDGVEEHIKYKFGVSKLHMIDAFNGIHATIQWLDNSIYKKVVEDIVFNITDEPINFPGELGVYDDDRFQAVIYLNIMAIAEDYKNMEYVLEMNESDVTCFEYAAFVCLHEVGHLFHGLVGGNGTEKRDRLFDYFDKGEYYYKRFVSEMKHGNTYKEKKKYRNIPHEKAADNFAKQCLVLMMKEL
ncbi:hypothetical protein BKP45_20550 [Anaerobacillus alkalidiazotrophicus]|uniref:Uncharacterized protein n=1 Tax=Anaerobacillus alkalidiazotrophicus TaxID=472963 RepID=A0A1S2LZT4_9BACI|nr:hypothetical protein [Anaerobacillus alkalidiazotrophicus]OIJ17948.1 hypothetical protein BKP45_20550 [Anaerobacillus alkalidiazotrophicus]